MIQTDRDFHLKDNFEQMIVDGECPVIGWECADCGFDGMYHHPEIQPPCAAHRCTDP